MSFHFCESEVNAPRVLDHPSAATPTPNGSSLPHPDRSAATTPYFTEADNRGPKHVEIVNQGLSGADALFDAVTDIGVDVAPVLEGACQHRLADSLEQVTNNVVDQPIPLRVVHNVADQGAGLTPVVVLGPQR